MALTDAIDCAVVGNADDPVTGAFTLCECSFTKRLNLSR